MSQWGKLVLRGGSKLSFACLDEEKILFVVDFVILYNIKKIKLVSHFGTMSAIHLV